MLEVLSQLVGDGMMKKGILFVCSITVAVTLGLAGCTESNLFGSGNQVTLEMHTKMFDFSTG